MVETAKMCCLKWFIPFLPAIYGELFLPDGNYVTFCFRREDAILLHISSAGKYIVRETFHVLHTKAVPHASFDPNGNFISRNLKDMIEKLFGAIKCCPASRLEVKHSRLPLRVHLPWRASLRKRHFCHRLTFLC